MRNLFLFLFALPSTGLAVMPVLNYKNVECRLFVDDKLVTTKSQSLMTLVIDEHMGRFAEIQFGDEKKKIQYQVLIEDDVKSKDKDAVLVLQNLLVDKLESSSEFSAKELTWLRLAQGTHSVSCDVK